MFRINQKIVFVDTKTLARNPDVSYPQINEVVTIDNIITMGERVFFLLKEYPIPIRGSFNAIWSNCFRPTDDMFAEEVLENIIEQIEEEYGVVVKSK